MALYTILKICFYIFLVSGTAALIVARMIKRKVKQQTINVDSPEPVFPVYNQLPKSEIINHTVENSKHRKGEGLVLGNQRQMRKKFRQSKYLYLKYGK